MSGTLAITTVSPLPGLTMVQAANVAFAALAKLNNGASAPTTGGTGLANMIGLVWHDTTANALKIRDQADTTWITLGTFDETSKTFIPAVPTTTNGDSNLVILKAYRHVLTTAALTAARTWTLPAAANVPAGQSVVVTDMAGGITAANTLTIQRAGSDTINGGTNVTLGSAYSVATFTSDGTSKWTARASQAAAVTNHGDSSYTILATDRVVATNAALTAPRTWTLPTAAAFPPGTPLVISDMAGGVTSTNTLTIARASSDTISGATSTVLWAPYQSITLISDGVSKWSDPVVRLSNVALTPPAAGASLGSRLLSTGQYTAEEDPRRNYVMNGGFDVWQEATSFTPTVAVMTYLADGWKVRRTGAANYTVTRQAGLSPSGCQYAMRVQRTNGTSDTNVIQWGHQIPSAVAMLLAGKTVTLAIDAAPGANASGNLIVRIITGTGVDETMTSFAFPTGSAVSSNLMNINSAGSVARTIGTAFAVPGGTTEMCVQFQWTPSGTAGAADYWDTDAIKLEAGATASAFEGLPVSETLSRACYYFERIGGDIANHHLGRGYADSTTHGFFDLNYLPKRVTPTLTAVGTVGTDFELQRQGSAVVAPTAIGFTAAHISDRSAQVDVTVAAGLTAGEGLGFKCKTTSGYITVDARL